MDLSLGFLFCSIDLHLQIQCNPYQATNGILHRTRTNNFAICMEIQKTSNSQSNLEKEEWNWRNQPAWLQDLLQSHSHQDSMVLVPFCFPPFLWPRTWKWGEVKTYPRISSVQSLSCVWLFVTPWTAAHQDSLSITNFWSLLPHVHWVTDAIQPTHPLLFPSLPAFSLSQHQGLFQWFSSLHHMAKVLELQHQSFQ